MLIQAVDNRRAYRQIGRELYMLAPALARARTRGLCAIPAAAAGARQ